MDPMSLIVWLAILVILIVVVWFLLTQITLPEPIGKIVLIVIVVVVAAIAISFLYSLVGHSGGVRLR